MAAFFYLAERVGFEPTKGYKPLLVFKTSAFNRSATSPVTFCVKASLLKGKYRGAQIYPKTGQRSTPKRQAHDSIVAFV